MLVRTLSQKVGTFYFPGDFQLLLFLIANVVSSVVIAPHGCFFRSSNRASFRFNHSELWYFFAFPYVISEGFNFLDRWRIVYSYSFRTQLSVELLCVCFKDVRWTLFC